MTTPRNVLSEFNNRRWGQTDVSPLEPRLIKIARLIRKLSPGKLLDIGCGDGGFSCQFLREGWDVWGVDLSEEQLQKARTKGIHAHWKDVSRGLDFPDGAFTTVVASEVIEHLVDTDSLLEEIRRVLQPHGTLLLTTANLASLNNRLRLPLGMYPTFMDYSVREGVGHVRYYTMPVLRRQMAQHGFVIQSESGSHVPVIPTRWTFSRGLPQLLFPLGFALGDALPTLSMELIVQAQRA